MPYGYITNNGSILRKKCLTDQQNSKILKNHKTQNFGSHAPIARNYYRIPLNIPGVPKKRNGQFLGLCSIQTAIFLTLIDKASLPL